jgi:hypothetical protein
MHAAPRSLGSRSCPRGRVTSPPETPPTRPVRRPKPRRPGPSAGRTGADPARPQAEPSRWRWSRNPSNRHSCDSPSPVRLGRASHRLRVPVRGVMQSGGGRAPGAPSTICDRTVAELPQVAPLEAGWGRGYECRPGYPWVAPTGERSGGLRDVPESRLAWSNHVGCGWVRRVRPRPNCIVRTEAPMSGRVKSARGLRMGRVGTPGVCGWAGSAPRGSADGPGRRRAASGPAAEARAPLGRAG